MVKTQIYFREDELEALHKASEESGESVSHLVRAAVREVVLKSPTRGPVALWDGVPKRTSMEIDSIYDEI